jgi:5-methylcytosine-specific restriction endonuclease McrA
VNERTCSKCGVMKPESQEFFRKRGTKDRGGLRPDCRDCSAARDRAYYEANKDKAKAYAQANSERIRSRMVTYKRAYYATPEGKAVIQRTNRKWNKSPAGKTWLALAQQQRRARLAGIPATLTAQDWAACRHHFHSLCAYCGSAGKLHQEHVVPVQDGGPYSADNIVPACGSCNSSKSTRALEDWFPRQPFYTEERMTMVVTYLSSGLAVVDEAAS